LDDEDIPHRTKMKELLNQLFEREYGKLLDDLKSSLGRVSFTTDMWSDQKLRGYMAITAHYIVR
ncbi:hypothetical protein K474DRAFT_1576510, partial [Panus rudis PR-1116 ss-1]